MAFRGTYDHTLDAKNRLTVPVKFRGPLGDGVIVARGIESCITIWTPQGFESWTAEMIEALGRLTPRGRDFRRAVSASAFETDLDAAGRVMLPAKLLEHAQVGKEVAVIGNDEAFEVWDRALWDAYDAKVAPTIAEMTDSIGADA